MVCGTPWRIVDAADAWPRIASRLPPGADGDDILADCQAGRAVCMECADGVLVVTAEFDDSGLEFGLFVLLAVGYVAGAFQRRESDLDVIAADLGATRIAMRAARRGWARMLGSQWVRQGDTFSREVNHGQTERGHEADGAAASAG